MESNNDLIYTLLWKDLSHKGNVLFKSFICFDALILYATDFLGLQDPTQLIAVDRGLTIFYLEE